MANNKVKSKAHSPKKTPTPPLIKNALAKASAALAQEDPDPPKKAVQDPLPKAEAPVAPPKAAPEPPKAAAKAPTAPAKAAAEPAKAPVATPKPDAAAPKAQPESPKTPAVTAKTQDKKPSAPAVPAKPASIAEQLAELQAGYQHLLQDRDNLRKIHAQFLQQHTQLQRTSDKALRDLARAEEANAAFHREQEPLQQAVAELQRQVTALWESAEQLKQEKADLTGECTRLREDAARLQTRINDLDRARTQLERERDQQRREHEVITGELQQRIKTMSDEMNQLQLLNRHYQKTIARLEEEHTELEKASRELTQIKGMYYYRWACKVDRLRVALGLRPDPKAGQEQLEAAERKLIEHKSAPATTPAPASVTADNNQPTAPAVSVQSAPRPRTPRAQELRQLTIGGILDKFTHACFEPECSLVTFRPDNWQSVMEATPVDLLLVESAWHGNGGSWQYRVGTYAAPPGRELDDLLAWCRARGIPTVFWNKEDPTHFEKFIAAAARFDYVFTTDAGCVERYRKHCGHERVDALPFAAQPRIHNPVLAKPRDRKTCFAGTYYADTFEARRQDMETLLRGGAVFGLEIYDRMHGYAGPDRARFAFPHEFQPLIRGRLDYEQMLEAYRQYQVFLNVNSIADSPTMFSRRVFELLACGTPVVTTPSVGIGAFFGDLVPQVRTPEEVRGALSRLLGDAAYWAQTSARGIRRVLAQHTYTHRLKAVCDRLGFSMRLPEPPALAVAVTPGGDAGAFAESMRLQTAPPAAVIVLGDGAPAQEHALRLGEAGLKVMGCVPERLEALLHENFADGCVAFVNSRDAHGPGYLADALTALGYCGRDITGLATHFAADGSGEPRLDTAAGEEHLLRERLLGETLVMRVHRLTAGLIAAAAAGGLVALPEPAYARGRFDFVAAGAGRLTATQRQQAFLKQED